MNGWGIYLMIEKEEEGKERERWGGLFSVEKAWNSRKGWGKNSTKNDKPLY